MARQKQVTAHCLDKRGGKDRPANQGEKGEWGNYQKNS